jgi:3-phenylpropionate/cinnamic acid dioxygenase small subunit
MPQNLLDYFEIQQLNHRYANAVDRRDWDALDAVFTPDAFIDYSAVGGLAAHLPAIKPWLAQALGSFNSYYHLVGNLEIEVHGDKASSRIACFNPMDMKPWAWRTVMVGIWYEDELLRTPQGWRITRRSEVPCFGHNRPWFMVLVQAIFRRKYGKTAQNGAAPHTQ